MYTPTKLTIPFLFTLLLLGIAACKKDKTTTPNTNFPFTPACTADEQFRKDYSDDAGRLALSYCYSHHLKDTANIGIDASMKNALLNALATVHNTHSLSRDSVIERYKLHIARPDNDTRELLLQGSKGVAWFEKLFSGNLSTGNPAFDKLNKDYHFSIKTTYDFPWGKTVVLRTAEAVNMKVLCEALNKIGGVGAEPNYTFGDGGSIELGDWNKDFIELVYSYGWGDCPSGCIARRYWKFRVRPDCNVNFVESYGSSGAP